MFGQLESLIIDKLLVYGPLGAIALFAFFSIRKYGPMLIDTHVSFVKDTSDTLGKIAVSSERQAESTEQIKELGTRQADTLQRLCEINESRDDTGRAVLVHTRHVRGAIDTNEALRLLCQAKVLETENATARQLIERAIDLLTPK